MLKQFRLAYFYFAVVLTAIIAMPVFLARPFNPKNSSFFFSVFSRMTLWSTGLKYEEVDRHILEKTRPSIVVANHQHNLDILMASLAFSKNVVVLGKKELLKIPFLGICFYLGGNVFVDRGNRTKAMQSLERVKQKLVKNGLSVIIFPEGTRNDKQELLPFKRGAFFTAIQTQLPVVPVAVSQYARTMDLNKIDSGKIKVRYLEPISTVGMGPGDAPKLARMAQDAIEKAIAEF